LSVKVCVKGQFYLFFLFGSNIIHDESLIQGCWTIKYDLFPQIILDLVTISEPDYKRLNNIPKI